MDPGRAWFLTLLLSMGPCTIAQGAPRRIPEFGAVIEYFGLAGVIRLFLAMCPVLKVILRKCFLAKNLAIDQLLTSLRIEKKFSQQQPKLPFQ